MSKVGSKRISSTGQVSSLSNGEVHELKRLARELTTVSNKDNKTVYETDMTITGDLTVTGNITATTQTFQSDVVLEDPILELGNGNTTDNINTGYTRQNASGKFSGMIRYHTDEKNYLFKDAATLPTTTTDMSTLGKADLVVANLEAITVNTGHGANELYAMDQDVKTTSGVTFASVDTGHGANELYELAG
jgi:hypothetical protein